ncbi:MAG: AAA family ATPase [Chlamydiota bacterium]
MTHRAFFIASTGQHVGKTTTSLGLLAGLSTRFSSVGFIKPIGQETTETSAGHQVDKDVLLVKDHFSLTDDETTMSPVLFPRGFTRDYLDGKVDAAALGQKIKRSFDAISQNNSCVVIEGTGHVGVGSIVNLSNAKVAALLGVPLILIASGGLGSSFDALCLNKVLCDVAKVKVAGIILNRVLKEKRDMILHYMEKALARWHIPILGCIPFDPFLSKPSMQDFEILFKASLLSGEHFHFRHFRHTRLVATSLKNFRELILPNQLIITPANREDIVLAILTQHCEINTATGSKEGLAAGIILTGDIPPRQAIIDALKKAEIPMLYAPVSSYKAMEMITSYTVKIRTGDQEKVKEAIDLAVNHINFEQLIDVTQLA